MSVSAAAGMQFVALDRMSSSSVEAFKVAHVMIKPWQYEDNEIGNRFTFC